MTNLLSIADLSQATGLEESLLRFYESEYPDELPQKVLQGDTLAFRAEAIESFKKIHARHLAGKDHERPQADVHYARVIAVTSGKGGVGKTNITLNLAIELQRLGKMCVILDADMGMANVHLLAGIFPDRDIMDILSSGAKISDLIQEGPEGIGIIPGGGGIAALADASRHDRIKVINALQEIEKAADIILVDTGAGMAANVRDFLGAADEILFVLTSDITSLADAYGLLKVLHKEKNIIGRKLWSVVNMVDTLKEAADVANRFTTCARQFLGLEVQNIGYLMKDSTVGGATVRRMPYSIFRPEARISKNTRMLAGRLMQQEMPDIQLGSAFGRYMRMIQSGDAST